MQSIIQNRPDRGRLSGGQTREVRGVDVDLAARELLREACAPVGFDRVRLAAAVAAFPVPREVGQLTTSGTWGRTSTLTGIQRSYAVAGGAGLGWREGRTFRLTLGPGVASCASFDATRRERAVDRLRDAGHREADLVIGRPLFKPWLSESGTPSRQVTMWSNKSRARMVKAFASVDWSGLARCYCGEAMGALVHTFAAAVRCEVSMPMPLAMVTLTYPGDWVPLARSGAAAKRHLALFRQRWARAMGWRLDGAWKLEFQRARTSGASQGERAPHFHLLVPVPARVGDLGYPPALGYERGVDFRVWLSATWADVVDAPGKCSECGEVYADSEYSRHLQAGTAVDFGPTARMSDPKRCAVYFLKHGSKSLDDKEYQHIVPDVWAAPGVGPGRFWGFWGMKPATVALDLDLGDFVTARRVLRHVAASRARGVKYERAKAAALAVGRGGCEAVRLGIDASRGRKLHTLGVGGQLSGGWVLVNDGPALAGALARAVLLRREAGV